MGAKPPSPFYWNYGAARDERKFSFRTPGRKAILPGKQFARPVRLARAFDDWQPSFWRCVRNQQIPHFQQSGAASRAAITGFTALSFGYSVRFAQHGRAFAFWRTCFQRRARNWQIPHSWQSGTAQCAESADSAFPAIGYSAVRREWESICPLTNGPSAARAAPTISTILSFGYKKSAAVLLRILY